MMMSEEANSECGSSCCSTCSSTMSDRGLEMIEDRPPSDPTEDVADRTLTTDDVITGCRDFYARRVQSLERFRFRCAHGDEPASIMDDKEERGGSNGHGSFTKLQSDMVSLMESDVSLTRQLIALGERIAELKLLHARKDPPADDHPARPRSPQDVMLSSASSMVSLDGIDEEDLNSIDDASVTQMAVVAPLASTFSDDDEDDGDGEEDEDDMVQRRETNAVDLVQYTMPRRREYFSRQNSILRIPIPPSRRRAPRLSETRSAASILKRASQGSASTTSSASSDGDGASCSGNSTVSSASSSSYAGWYAARKRSAANNVDRVRVVSSGSLPTDKFSLTGARIDRRHHSSRVSCDSGVHHLNQSLEVLDAAEELVFV